MDIEFSTEEIRMLAKAERDMDSGDVKFVMYRGGRTMVFPEVMDELGLENGQTISDVIFGAILQSSIAHLEAKIALDNAQKKE